MAYYLTRTPGAYNANKSMPQWESRSPITAERLNGMYQTALDARNYKVWKSAEVSLQNAAVQSATGLVMIHDLNDVPDFFYFELIRKTSSTRFAINQRIRVAEVHSYYFTTTFTATTVKIQFYSRGRLNEYFWIVPSNDALVNSKDWDWQLFAFRF